MYKNAHLQNITPGPGLGMEESEDSLQSWSWTGRRVQSGYLWFFQRGMVLIMWDQNRPSHKSRPSLQGSAPLTLAPHWPPLLQNQNLWMQNIRLQLCDDRAPRPDMHLHVLAGFDAASITVGFQQAPSDAPLQITTKAERLKETQSSVP